MTEQTEAVTRDNGPEPFRLGYCLLVSAIGIAGIIAIALIDQYLGAETRSIPVIAAMDYVAHLATTFILLAAFLRVVSYYFLAGAVVGSLILDVGHIPILLSDIEFTQITSRPSSHSLLVAVVFILPILLTRGRYQALFVGICFGNAFHLFRDAATGGIPLWWPFSASSVELAYAPYVMTLTIFALMPMAGAFIAKSNVSVIMTDSSRTHAKPDQSPREQQNQSSA